MFFRKGTMLDVGAVTEIYDTAREIMKKSNIPQWQDGIPGRETFISDVQSGCAYVLEENGEVIGTVQIIDYEPYYALISNGSWTVDNALVAHRVAVSDKCRKQGVGSMLISEAEKIALQKGKKALRLDTHEKNYRMRGMLEKNGFKAVGTVFMPDGSPRVAYEKLL